MTAPAELVALGWMEKAVALAVALQTVELLRIRETLRPDGIWSWDLIRRDFAGLPRLLRGALDLLLSYPSIVYLLAARLGAALLLLGFSHPALTLTLLLSTTLVCLRWRGTYNGGSDHMTLLLLLALGAHSASAASGWGDPGRVARGALWYVALQTCLSYFVAGLAKLQVREWRDGTALARLLRSASYGVPAAAQGLSLRPRACLALAWGILAFECAFPLALLAPALCAGFVGSALVFHLANVYVFGLNRFFFAWAAAHPALLYAAWSLDIT